MIAHVTGIVAEKVGNSIIVDVAGVGYEVQTPLGDYEAALLNESIKFYTYHHVREQSQELFGFSSLASKKLFELLITVQGVGPKAALAILSLGASEHVRNAIANADPTFISKANGVGKKTAERVVVDLADKVGVPVLYATGIPTQTVLNVNDEALEALIALGYSLADATKALEKVDPSLPTNQRVTQALRE
jgi:Holliday junction DNA helicase RuvA